MSTRLEAGFLTPLPSEASAGLSQGHPCARLNQPPFRTIYVDEYALPGYITRIDMQFKVPLLKDCVVPPSLPKWVILNELLPAYFLLQDVQKLSAIFRALIFSSPRHDEVFVSIIFDPTTKLDISLIDCNFESFVTFHLESPKWNIGAESLLDQEDTCSHHTGPCPSPLTVNGGDDQSIRYCANGAFVHKNRNTITLEPWDMYQPPDNDEYAVCHTSLEVDLRHGHTTTLRVFQGGAEQRKVFFDLPRCPVRFSARLGEKHACMLIDHVCRWDEPTEMQKWLFYSFEEW
ncbi:hypothetical protein BLNAU_6770 [Blattamonas nauphoetae]|uniref:Uncharacterized protein n=1 Tax=Blattamonas nauphoetae TaxID=2049346 RepID=A0ABQ9Y3L4_9EUKA|nr:hypothetical protein BLNAU_6770 [Blattamonas nauphoetae]